jgi:diguanylate cyclase (GGDEF)-like protein
MRRAPSMMSLVKRMMRLYDFHFELSLISDRDELCRKVVEKGPEYTGFNRLSLWFIDPGDPDWFIGSCGIDEKAPRIKRDPDVFSDNFLQTPVTSLTWKKGVVYHNNGFFVPLWNGRETIGLLCGEGERQHNGIPREESQILLILARTVGHLLTILGTKEKLRKNAEEMEKLASFDYLTGLYTRTIGTRLLHQQISMAKRNNNNLILCYMDLDGLKMVNDSLGHNRGDDFIRLIADKIKISIRQSDIACRMGGDEFMIVLPDSSMKDGEIMMDRLKQTALKDRKLHDFKPPPWFCYGYSQLRNPSKRWENPDINGIILDLIQEADQNMYRQKKDKNL